MQLYADDTVLYYFSSSIDAIQDSLNTDLIAIAEWLNVNKLTLNLEKSKFMLFGGERNKKKTSEDHLFKLCRAKSTRLNHSHSWGLLSRPI